MSQITLAPRRRRLWPVFVMPTLLLVAAAAWSVFWLYTASQVDQTVDAWRAREAASGRAYDCAKRSVAGFPFRLEVRCEGVTVGLTEQTAGQTATQTLTTAQLSEILVVAQVYDPQRLIAEFKGPATLAEGGGTPSLSVTWSKGRSSVVGLPGVPQRISLEFDAPLIERIAGADRKPLASARHVEAHARRVDGATPDQPAIETVVQLAGASVPDVHPVLAETFDADVRAVLRGVTDFAPKPWPERLRQIQAAGGRVEIVASRIAQGELLATGTGSLGLTAAGHLDGEIQMIVAGIEKIIPALGIDKMLEQGVPQATLDRVAPGVKSDDVTRLMGALDRAIPGLGKAVRQNANAGVAAGINSLGKEATLDGRKARAFPLRFADGAVFLGPLKIAQTPPLF